MDIVFGFGGGSISKEEWDFIKNECDNIKAQNILEIGAGNSTLCFMEIAKRIDSFETEDIFIEALLTITDPESVTLYKYTYPNFPSVWNFKYDVAFVDGPGRGNTNGRMNSMLFAKSLSDYIFIHDFSRANEAKAREIVFPQNEWQSCGNKKSTLLLKRIKND